ncbi:phospholipid scramblase 2-like [Rhinatrema bivittatum]|uniref:phospholipid scramblase 2-like n=1 Tax=Rhinatrema bivittatum TaxID=194408 RepID=UPI001126D4FE|nr:phospholipid scramblase 2-like [Rhinatrema bivittatum]XP_029437245.1 phospholipid scramblase 2-like [Rhinatrema bivittatum]XP_029437246.1 phospholipid scramblase 2-like [Rhinatrema bivittatum]XP_029437247.1 phospholipid scramblase 2-like [Rhinatrema bivittatum]XP_029437248.1 phospholipid scramblase 2-like [Rhinatrema bivittatum]XP_029437249.1 phospholipid scramblase 2-like [Rhinatrema bivittatum]
MTGRMSAPGDPLTQPKMSQDQPPDYQSLGPSQPSNLPYQLQPQANPVPDPKSVVQIPGMPPGLEYLLQINQIIIQQKYFTTQSSKTYEILNSAGQRIFLGKQDLGCCGPSSNVMIMDNSDMEVIQMLRPCKCTCSYEAEIHSPPGTIIGYATVNWHAYVTSLSISNASKETVLLIVGPGFQTNIFGDVNFEVKSRDETQTVGQITRDKERFIVQFPLDLDVKIKVVLLGAAIFLDNLVEMKRRELEARSRNNN